MKIFSRRIEVKEWLNYHNIECYIIHDDLTVDVEFGNISIKTRMVNIPIQFGVVGGDFDCSRLGLTTLKGFPKLVDGYFDCSWNNLESLKYLPEIKGWLYCDDNLKDSGEYYKWKYHYLMNQRNE